jgi:ribosome biogenesis GTPase
MLGLVIKSTGKWYQVKDEHGEMWQCRVRGKLRIKGIKSTNPIAVGDTVLFESEGETEFQGVIMDIEPRRNYIIRRSVNLSKESQIVASNVDQAFLVVTLVQPKTTTGFMDRFLVTAEAYSIPVVIVFNKTDLYNQEQFDEMERLEKSYLNAGYTSERCSAVNGENVDKIYSRMAGKINIVSGHSGVGKSTLINVMQPGLNIKTSELSEYHDMGVHTTTFAEMHELSNGGYIIDTPGIKGFGIIDIPKEELHHHFPDFFELLPQCKFHNCLHVSEPGCAVIAAIKAGDLPESRYRSYMSMYSDEETPYR